MANYLISGAAGFIASRVASLLLEQGHHVHGIDNMNDSYDIRMKEYRLQNLQAFSSFTFEKVDIAKWDQIEALSQRLGQVDAVINLAARAGVRASVENPWLFYETNLTGTLNLLELCRIQAVPKFILASTSSVYGADAIQPTPETASSSEPLQPYAASKKAAETLAFSYHYLHGLDVTIFRYFTVYGPAGRPDMAMFRFAQWIAEGRPVTVNGDGNQSRGFTFVDDIARGTILGLQPLGYQVINLGGHEAITINDLVGLFESRLGKRAQVVQQPLNKADMLSNLADISKARTLLGWEPQINLADGVTRLTDWYCTERVWASQIRTE